MKNLMCICRASQHFNNCNHKNVCDGDIMYTQCGGELSFLDITFASYSKKNDGFIIIIRVTPKVR